MNRWICALILHCKLHDHAHYIVLDIFQAPLQNCWSAAAVISTKIMCRTKPDLRQIEDLRLRHERVEGVKEQYEGATTGEK